MNDEFFLPEEVMEWVALKKSEYLSTLIQNHTPDDIQIEEYHLFDQYVPKTISEADRSFQQVVDNNQLRTYVRAYAGGTQVVIGAVFPDDKKNSDVFVPILTFVSKKNDLIKIFCVGAPISAPTMN